MVLNLYSLYDRVACEHSPQLNSCKNDAVAVRMFEGSINGKSVIDPDDYSLFNVGSFDTETGKVSTFDVPRQVPIVVEGHVEDGNGAS